MPINTVLLNLLESRVTLYATNSDGSIGSALWSGQVAERLQVAERWLNVETRPSGARYPRQHPIVPQFTISIDRVWALPLNNIKGFHPDQRNYILEILWTEEELGVWHRRTFYGVTISERNFQPATIETEFVDGQQFQAQYFIPDTGSAYTSASPVQANPLIVNWLGSDGFVPLYSYDAGSGFTALTGDNTRATIAADGSSIQFSGAGSPVLATTSDGVSVNELHDTLPADLPQLQFCIGSQLMAVVTPTGLWARNLSDALPAGTDLFSLLYNGTAAGNISATLTAATAWDAAN